MLSFKEQEGQMSFPLTEQNVNIIFFEMYFERSEVQNCKNISTPKSQAV